MVPFIGLGIAVVLPFVTASCSKKACFQWTRAEGACPSQEEALAYFEGPPECGTDILSVDSEADFDGELCCYDVSGGDTSEAPCARGSVGSAAVTTAVSTGAGPQGCFGCGDVVFSGLSPICESSFPLVNNLMTCVCDGACATACSATPCGVPLFPDGTCFDCMSNSASGCGNELNACSSDFGSSGSGSGPM
jgi:hypothetical protein